jgi:adenine/guanine phosphoribosyltransferase-like PRPP-binding protein
MKSKGTVVACCLGVASLAGALWHFWYRPWHEENQHKKKNRPGSSRTKERDFVSPHKAALPASDQSIPFPAYPSFTVSTQEEEEVAMNSLFEVSTAIVTLGVPGSGRATIVDTLRPWLGDWGFQTRHLTIANVLGQGYTSGGYSADQVDALQNRYRDLTSVDATAYVSIVCQKAWERSRSPTIFMISDLTTEAEIRYLKQRFSKVFVLHVVTSPTADGLPFADDCIRNTGSREDLVETSRRYFASTLLPYLKDFTSLADLSKKLHERAISYTALDGKDLTYYDTNSLFANPSTLFSCMYIFSALLKTMDMGSKIDAIVAVSSKAVPLTTCLSYMLRKPNPSLLYHTHAHDDLVPYPVEWVEGDSAVGHFAVGWAPHLLEKGSRILLIDDILATGRRAEKVGALAEHLGYEVVSLGVLFTLEGSGAKTERPKDEMSEAASSDTATLDFPIISLLREEVRED